MSFIYLGSPGSEALQKNVQPGAIDETRAAYIRGLVRTREGAPVAGVRVSVREEPELGHALTRNDGAFEIVVNGGGVVVLTFSKSGFLPAQRSLKTQWKGLNELPPLALVPPSQQATSVAFGPAVPAQVATSSIVVDADGTRSATLLIPAGTSADLVAADGSIEPASSLTLRATEYTVGPTGPEAMPASLPPTSGYTYAVELSADEAAAGSTVRFSQPIFAYVENFLNFPVGIKVPAGYFDYKGAIWNGSDDGRVIRVLGLDAGLALLDVTGSGAAADATALAGLEITDAERELVGARFPVGQSLWRVPIPHLTPWDFNWPYVPPTDARSPNVPKPDLHDPKEDPEEDCGSILDCHNQTLGEIEPISGTPYSLVYSSARIPKRNNQARLTLSGASLPASLRRANFFKRLQWSRSTYPNDRSSGSWSRCQANLPSTTLTMWREISFRLSPPVGLVTNSRIRRLDRKLRSLRRNWEDCQRKLGRMLTTSTDGRPLCRGRGVQALPSPTIPLAAFAR
jgi:hypothetical protein